MAARPPRPTAISMVRVARPSTVDLIAAELRSAIFTGALPVGSPIGEVEMAAQLGVSRSPLREAAQRLLQEGLLTASPGRGMRVSVIGSDHVADLYEGRRAIEMHAARILAGRRDAATLDRLEEAYSALVAASEGTDAVAIGDADLAFHRLLVDEAGSRRLSLAMATLAIETRIASFSDPNGYNVRRSVSPTYRRLLDALRDGDEGAAASALDVQFADAVARLTGQADEVETIERAADQELPALGPIEFADEI